MPNLRDAQAVRVVLASHMPIDKASGSTHRCPPKGEGVTEKLEEKTRMTKLMLDSLLRLRKDEAGQGLVEYLLILALIAFAATAGMGSLASGLNSAFSAVGSILGAYIT